MTQKITPTITWEENEKGTLIGTATLDDGRVVQYSCRNKGDDGSPKWVHLRSISREKSEPRLDGDVELSIEFELNGGEEAQTRMRSIYLCMKDLRELVKTL